MPTIVRVVPVMVAAVFAGVVWAGVIDSFTKVGDVASPGTWVAINLGMGALALLIAWSAHRVLFPASQFDKVVRVRMALAAAMTGAVTLLINAVTM